MRRRKRKPRIYLNNQDLLAEIAESKKSFCWLKDDKYYYYDCIVTSAGAITPELVAELEKKRKRKHNKDGLPENIVIRVYSEDHVPEDQLPKINFRPFIHYEVTVSSNSEINMNEVCRSHWKGTLVSGEFCQTHGNITDKLTSMIMLLVKRYSQRSNWRHYTWLEDMRSQAALQLLENALKFDELKSSNPFAYYTCIVSNSFKGTLNSEERQIKIKDQYLIAHGKPPSLNYLIEYEMKTKNWNPLYDEEDDYDE